MNRIFFILITFLIFTSCNYFEDKKREEVREIEIHSQKKELEILKSKYLPIRINEEELMTKYSFELEELYLNKNVILQGKIGDIERINDSTFLLHIIGGYFGSEKIYCNLNTDKGIVNKLLEIRDEKMLKYSTDNDIDRYFINDIFYGYSFVFNLERIKKGFHINSYLDDYSVYSEENEGYEIDEYDIDIEVDDNGFILFGSCLDFTDTSRLIFEE